MSTTDPHPSAYIVHINRKHIRTEQTHIGLVKIEDWEIIGKKNVNNNFNLIQVSHRTTKTDSLTKLEINKVSCDSGSSAAANVLW